MLAENKRLQLDSIVQQMAQNRESDDTIQFVVNDFKNKYETEEPEEPFVEKTARVLDMFFGGGKLGEAIGTGIAKTKIGRKLVGAPEIPEESEQFIKGPTKGEVAGSILQSAALFTPGGTIAKGITGGARALGMVRGASALGKIGSGLLAGELFDISANLQHGKTGKNALTPGIGTLIGGAIPSVEVAKNVIVRFGEKQAPRIINSLIRPLAKDFSYGKNPGRAVAEEGIVANNFDDLIDKIRTTRQTIGREIGELGDTLSDKPIIRLRVEALKPFEEAIKEAASQNNVILLGRLNNVKRAITEVLEPYIDDAGNLGIKSLGSRNLDNLTFKQTRNLLTEIGDMTQFTGNPSDDKLINATLKKVYGGIKEASLKYANALNPNVGREFTKLTEKYADLQSAEIAARYRDKIIERHNLIGLSPQVVGVGGALITAVATGGATIPSLAVGASAAVIDKLAQTPGFKTRLAYIFSKKTHREVNYLFQKIPALSKFFSTKEGIFPGDILLGENGEVVSREIADYIKSPKLGLSIQDVSKSQGLSQTLRGTKGMTADQITQKFPDIVLKREVPATDIYGNKVKIPEGEALTPYELKGNKVLLQDGETYIVSKNQYQNIKGNAVSGEAKPFAPELSGTEESIHGGAKSIGSWKQESSGDFNATINGKNLTITKEGSKFYVYEKGGLLGKTVNSLEDAKSTAQMYADQAQQITKYSQYQLPGGKNYKEILIKAPVNTPENLIIKQENGRFNIYDPTDNALIGEGTTKSKAIDNAVNRGWVGKGETFKSSHWDEPNVISHLRLNERTYKGKKVTLIEELQSDWAREARKNPFVSDPSVNEYLKLSDNYGDLSKAQEERFYKLESELDNKYQMPNDDPASWLREKLKGTPNNSLLKNWQELSVKRALKEAVDNNSEYLAWTTGEQQAARYNLSHEVDKIEWNGIPGTAENKGKSVQITFKGNNTVELDVNSNGVVSKSTGPSLGEKFVGKKLDEVIGKGVAEKINTDTHGELKGEGLNIGGEWATTLYGNAPKAGEKITGQIKNIVEDITGGRVEIIKLSTGNERQVAQAAKGIGNKENILTSQQAIRLTPEIKALVRGEAIPLKKASGRLME